MWKKTLAAAVLMAGVGFWVIDQLGDGWWQLMLAVSITGLSYLIGLGILDRNKLIVEIKSLVAT